MNFLIRAAAIAAMLHITPIVVLVKRSDAVQALLPGADAYVAREVHLSGTDAHRLHETVDWSPEDGVLVFYGGTAGSTSVGALEFVRVRSEEHTSELQSLAYLVCRLLLEKKKRPSSRLPSA